MNRSGRSSGRAGGGELAKPDAAVDISLCKDERGMSANPNAADIDPMDPSPGADILQGTSPP